MHTESLGSSSMIRSLFEKHLKFLKVKVYWRDSDMDYVRIKSDEELNIAVVEMKTEIINLFVVAHHYVTEGHNSVSRWSPVEGARHAQ